MITCKIHVRIDFFHISLINDGLSSIHTINNRKAIHILANHWKFSFHCNKFGKSKVSNIHDRIYQIIIGCLKSFMIHKTTKTTPISTHKLMKKLSCIKSNVWFKHINSIQNIKYVKYSKTFLLILVDRYLYTKS